MLLGFWGRTNALIHIFLCSSSLCVCVCVYMYVCRVSALSFFVCLCFLLLFSCPFLLFFSFVPLLLPHCLSLPLLLPCYDISVHEITHTHTYTYKCTRILIFPPPFSCFPHSKVLPPRRPVCMCVCVCVYVYMSQSLSRTYLFHQKHTYTHTHTHTLTAPAPPTCR